MSESNYWNRISRRRLVGSAAAFGGLAAVGGLAACGDDDDDSKGGDPTKPAGGSSPAAAQPRQGGTFRITNTGATGIQDPQFGNVPTYVNAWFGDPFLKLTNKDRKLSPGVIEKWEQPDKNTLILKVRPGVKFFNMAPANGRALEAKDIVYTIRSMTGSLYPDSKIPFPRKSLLTGAKEPVLVDPSTVRIETTSPRSTLLLSLAESRNAVLPEGLREHFGGVDSLFAPRPERLVGTGPYIAKAIDPKGEAIWERNPDYWDKPYPYFEKVQYQTLPDGAAQVSAVITGQASMLPFVTPADAETIKRGLPNVQLPTFPLNGFYHIGFNTRNKPLNDPRVRKALAMMFDKPGFSRAIVGKDFVPGPLPWVYAEALSQDELRGVAGLRSPSAADIADAKKLLEAAGAGSFSLNHSAAVDIGGISAFKAVAEHFKEQVEKNLPGIKVNIEPTTYTGMLALIPKPDAWDTYAGGWSQEMTPTQMLDVALSKGGRNFTGWANATLDKFLDDAFAEFDEAKRTEILRSAQRFVIKDEWPIFPTHQGAGVIAVRPEVENLDVGGVGFHEHWVRYANAKA